ncbi:hypothetical protein Tco_1491604 [Tanacetum coccineum]
MATTDSSVLLWKRKWREFNEFKKKNYCEVLFQMGTIRDTLTEGGEGALHLGPMILEGSELTKDDRESQLYDEFEHFCQIKGETIHDTMSGEQVTNFDDNVDDVGTQCGDMSLKLINAMHSDLMLMRLRHTGHVQDHDTFVDHMDEYHEVHEMQNDVQHNYVVDSDADYRSDSNIIPVYKVVREEAIILKKDFKQKEDKFLEEFLDIKRLKEKVEDRLYKQDQSVQTVHMICKPKSFYDDKNNGRIGYKNSLMVSTVQ